VTWAWTTAAGWSRIVVSQLQLSLLPCEAACVTSDGGGGQRKLRGCGEGAMSTAQHGEHAEGWVADGEGEW